MISPDGSHLILISRLGPGGGRCRGAPAEMWQDVPHPRDPMGSLGIPWASGHMLGEFPNEI